MLKILIEWTVLTIRSSCLQKRLEDLQIAVEEQRLAAQARTDESKLIIDKALQQQDKPLDDSQVVDELFGFLPKSSSEVPSSALSQPPSAFNVGFARYVIIKYLS